MRSCHISLPKMERKFELEMDTNSLSKFSTNIMFKSIGEITYFPTFWRRTFFQHFLISSRDCFWKSYGTRSLLSWWLLLVLWENGKLGGSRWVERKMHNERQDHYSHPLAILLQNKMKNTRLPQWECHQNSILPLKYFKSNDPFFQLN